MAHVESSEGKSKESCLGMFFVYSNFEYLVLTRDSVATYQVKILLLYPVHCYFEDFARNLVLFCLLPLLVY